MNPVFVTGGGYLGRLLNEALLENGPEVHALARRGSETKLPARAYPVIGDALDAATFVEARIAGEVLVQATGTPSTILRPWYVLGPRHRWPYALLPVYMLLGAIPVTRDGARRLGLVTHHAMVRALVRVVENPPGAGLRIVEVPEIRAAV